MVVPKSFVDYHIGTERYVFRVAFAENQSLVAVYDPTKDSIDELFIIIDFNTRESWPIADFDIDKYAEAKKKAVIHFEQLQRENPDLPRPSGLFP